MVTKAKAILLLSAVLVFAAGASLGVFLAHVGGPPKPPSWLAGELNLTGEQREQMRKIWSEVMEPPGGPQEDKHAALAQKRDQAIVSLLTDEQRSRYDAIVQDYASQMEQLSQIRKRAFDEAVERTKKILTPEQAAKYDELMKKQRDHGPGGFFGPHHRHGGPSSDPTTEERPASHGEERPQTTPATGA